MNEDLIKSVEEKIKNCEETKLAANSRIISLRKQIEEAERDLFRANNVQASLKGALKNLIDANDRDEDIAAIRPIQGEEKSGEEPSAMEKIADHIEEEIKEVLTDEEILKKNKETLDNIEKKEEEVPFETDEEKEKRILEKGDKLIKRETEKQRAAKAGWPTCPVCLIRKMAPWNKTGKCAYCQTYKKKKKDDL